MKNIFFYILLASIFFSNIKFNAQSQSAAVLSVYTQSAKISPEMAESVLRVEMTKTEQFKVIDKLDMKEILEENQIDITNCYGKKCLLRVGKSAGVDKVITGSIENLGKKIVITVKILDIASESYDKVAIEEFINLDSEIQNMVKIVVNKSLGIENSKEILSTLVYFNQPPETPTTYLKNNGPRMGLSYVIGNTSKVLSAPKISGGLGFKSPVVMSQIGYQFEGSYLSAGDFQALIEGMIFLNGIEKEMFSPSFALLNGFRSSKNGWEFGFGPTFRLTKKVLGQSGTRESEDFSFTTAKEFDKIVLSNEKVTEIISVTDSANNKFYQVPFLAQDTIFEEIENTGAHDPELNQYNQLSHRQGIHHQSQEKKANLRKHE